MSEQLTTFYLKVSRPYYEAEVVPWLKQNIGFKRGGKTDWYTKTSETSRSPSRLFVPTKKHPTPPEPTYRFRADVSFKHSAHAGLFLSRFEDLVGDSFVFTASHYKGKLYTVTLTLEEARAILRWMSNNLPPRVWTVSGASIGGYNVWQFYLLSDEAVMAIKMLSPANMLRRA